MKAVFLSSTFHEMREYRAAAAEAVDQFGYRCVRMETFPAKDREIAGFCRDRLRDCDVVVVILGRFYGTPIPQRDISYSEDEFDAASELGKTILVFEPERGAKANTDDALAALEANGLIYEDQIARQRRFVKKAHQGRLVRTFKNESDLKFQVGHSLAEHFKDSRGGYAGERLPHLCDRTLQLDQFGESFQRGTPGQPEIYVVHGHEDEQHKHCVQRLICFHISYPRRWSSAALVGPAEDRALVEWPVEGDAEDIRFNRLCRRLFQSLDPACTFTKGYGGNAFCELAVQSGVSFLRFRHVLRQERWTTAAQQLCLNYYLPFWGDVARGFAASFGDRVGPRVLVFFELKHQGEGPADEAFRSSLETVFTAGAAANGVTCRILPELPRVQIEDLEAWYDRYEKLLLTHYRNRSARTLFPRVPLRMIDVESRLRELVGLEDYGR
jgi:hypothetical protein